MNNHEVVIGASGCGKSTMLIRKIIEEAERGDSAIVVEDPHPRSLAYGIFSHLVARGMEHRVLYDRLHDLDYYLGYEFLKPSRHDNPLYRRAENEQRIHAFTDILLRRRGADSLAATPVIEEWVKAALWLYVETETPPTLDVLPKVFLPRNRTLKQMLDQCRSEEMVSKFRDVYDGTTRQGQTAPARRFIEGVCNSQAFALRCQRGFDLPHFLARKGILLVEGGSVGTLSFDAMTIMLGSISLMVLDYVKNRPRPFPRLTHVLDEANNAALVDTHEMHALAELRKANYGLKICVQQLDFPSQIITNGVLTNTAAHHWFRQGSTQSAQQASADLGIAQAIRDGTSRDPRSLRVGERYLRTPSGVSFGTTQPLEEAWIFPDLTEKNTEAARKKLQKTRPEYRRSSTQNPRTGGSETTKSSNEQDSTSVAPDTSSPSSPADRLATDGWSDSENERKEGSN